MHSRPASEVGTATERDSCAIPSGVTASGRVMVPPSKSVTQRLTNMALLSRGAVTIERPLLADDTVHFLTGLEAIGCSVSMGAARVDIQAAQTPLEAEVDCGMGGTMLRFLTASLCSIPGRWRLDGHERLRERPVGPLVSALRELGAEIRHLGADGHAPLEIEGGSLSGGAVVLDAGESSQYLSALLMASTRARSPVEIEVSALTSKPYVALTIEAMKRFGADVESASSSSWKVTPSRLGEGVFRVDGDWSAASYPAAAAALTGGGVELDGVAGKSLQGDRGFLEVLGSMGARITDLGDSTRVEGTGRLQAVAVDMSDMPDQVPTLAALAPFAEGVTTIRNVGHLRIKESDRLHAVASELAKAGAVVEERDDGLRIEGLWFDRMPPSDRVVVETWNDHRIAMSMAVFGLRRPGLVVSDPAVVTKSYPSFWTDLAVLLEE